MAAVVHNAGKMKLEPRLIKLAYRAIQCHWQQQARIIQLASRTHTGREDPERLPVWLANQSSLIRYTSDG